MKKISVRSAVLALSLLVSSAAFAFNPYTLCVNEAFKKQARSLDLEQERFMSEMQMCYSFPFESERYLSCLAAAEKRHGAAVSKINAELGQDKKACRDQFSF
ncbi:MAG: hypothetical protein HQK50_15205 [Oligoflexia bacterium]|nr:hypothetical protein [Oligoflexia bacterium]